MKRIRFTSFIMTLACLLAFASCSKDDYDFIKDVVCDTYEYHISGIVTIDGEKYELPAEEGTLRIYPAEDAEWNLKFIMTTDDGKCYTTSGSCANKEFIGFNHFNATYTIDGEAFRTIVNGQGQLDSQGNMELRLTLVGTGIKTQSQLISHDVHLVAFKK